MQAHPPSARLPQVPFDLPQPRQFLPGLPAVARAKQGGVFHPGIDRVWIGGGGFEIPDARELPGVLRAIVPLMGAGVALVDKLVADRIPGLTAVIGTLDHLSKPATGLGGV